jgi:uncharacterized protein (TIGR02996 family)
MSQREGFLGAIRAQPEDDTHRLVYADWLEENGEEVHARLIRVQCELANRKCKGARRKELRAAEQGLLEDPSLHLSAERPFKYERGFIGEHCQLFFTGAGFHLEVSNPERNPFADQEEEEPMPDLTAETIGLLDKMLDATLALVSLDGLESVPENSLFARALRRVTELECFQSTANDDAMICLATSPHLVNLEAVTFHDTHGVPLGAVLALFTAPAHRGLLRLHLDGEDWQDEAGEYFTGDDAPELVAFVEKIAQDPRAARLASLQLNYYRAGNAVAQALLDSPYLAPSEQLALVASSGLSAATKRALKKRFGKSLVLI